MKDDKGGGRGRGSKGKRNWNKDPKQAEMDREGLRRLYEVVSYCEVATELFMLPICLFCFTDLYCFRTLLTVEENCLSSILVRILTRKCARKLATIAEAGSQSVSKT